MKYLFLDESGTNAGEPFIVVAGVMVDDSEISLIETAIQAIVDRHIPEEDRRGFVLHASHISSNNGYFKDKDLWPLARRLPILDELTDIPIQLALPIVLGPVKRAKFPSRPRTAELDDHAVLVAAQAVAFSACSMFVEKIMRNYFPGEVVQLVMERNDETRAVIEMTHAFYGDAKALAEKGIEERYLPFLQVADSIHFLGKENRLLQLADAIVFHARGHLAGYTKTEANYQKLTEAMIVRPRSDFDGIDIELEPAL